MIKTMPAGKAISIQPSPAVRVLSGLAIVLILSILAWWVAQQVYKIQLPLGIPGKVLEYPLWAALAGLAGNLVLRLTKLRETVRPGIRTELFLKIGLVLLGAGIDLKLIFSAAGGAIVQTLILIPTVFFFGWWVGGKLGLDNKLRAVMSTALAVCGVSAAIAAAGSVSARKEQVTYITGLVILVALPMMVIAPLLAQAMQLPDAVAGAWFGGNIDTTAAVIGAGTIYGEAAQKMASIVKNTQNTLIGVVAFLLAVFFAGTGEDGAKKRPSASASVRPSARVIWDRFPKFILGFILASILFSLGWINQVKPSTLDAMKNWAFTLAFVCMGLELSLAEFKHMGWRPVAVFLIVTVFNTLLALLCAWVLFNYVFPVAF